jgi:drug/metabolite transporter (DMT)-like permease
MIEPLQFTFIFYFLILPIVIGCGVDSRIRNRYAIGALCGVLFYLFVSFWTFIGISASISVLEPVFILIALGFSILIIGFFFEMKRKSSKIQRHALVFLTISASGIPLFVIKAIVDGTMGIEYPASLLPLTQFTLAIVGLVLLANILEARMYAKNEAKDRKIVKKSEDLLDMKFEDMDERDFDGIPLPERNFANLHNRPDVSHADLNYDADEFNKMQ